MGDLSAADVLAMTKDNNGGFLEGNGIIILLLFLLFLGGGFGGYGGNNAMQSSLTRAELADGFQNQNIVNDLNGISTTINNGFANVNLAMNNGFNGLAMGMNNGFNGVNQNLNSLGFQMQQCCCDLKTTMGIQGDLTRQLINTNTMQDLRDKIADKDRELNSAIFAASQLTQTKTLEDFILANKSSS